MSAVDRKYLRSWVNAGRYGWIETNRIKLVDLTKDIDGYDIMTFEYENQAFESSVVYAGYIPKDCKTRWRYGQ